MNIRGTSSFLDGLLISIVPFLTFISIILGRDHKKRKHFQEIVNAYFMYLIHVKMINDKIIILWWWWQWWWEVITSSQSVEQKKAETGEGRYMTGREGSFIVGHLRTWSAHTMEPHTYEKMQPIDTRKFGWCQHTPTSTLAGCRAKKFSRIGKGVLDIDVALHFRAKLTILGAEPTDLVE